MAHTVGNWRAIKREKIGEAEWAVAWSDDDELVCDIVYTEDDARLIAAAPELLEALEAVLDTSGARGAYRSYHSRRYSEAVEKAENAIARAKEPQP